MRLLAVLTVLSVSAFLTACATTSPPLATMSSADPAAAKHNAEGIEHYNLGHWDVARGHFEAAIKADPKLAEPHYNLALALHKMGAHGEATPHFQKAAELAPGDRAITGSSAYRYHMAPPPTAGGGYGYGGGMGY